MMIKKVIINDFFKPDNLVELNFDNNLLILTGDNGAGKTTILNIVYYALMSNFFELKKYDFSKIEITFENEFEKLKSLEIKVLEIKKISVFEAKYNYTNEKFTSLLVSTDNRSGIGIIGSDKLGLNKNYYNTQDEIKHTITKTFLDDFKDVNFEEYLLLNRLAKYCNYSSINSDNSEKIAFTKDSGSLEKSIDGYNISSILKLIKESIIYFPTYRRIDIDLNNYITESQATTNKNELGIEKFSNMLFSSKFNINDRRVIGIGNSDFEEIFKEYSAEINKFLSLKLNLILNDYVQEIMQQSINTNTNKEPFSSEKAFSSFETRKETVDKLKKMSNILNLRLEDKMIYEYAKRKNERNKYILRTINNEKLKGYEHLIYSSNRQEDSNIDILYNLYTNFENELSTTLEAYNYIASNIEIFTKEKIKLIKNDKNDFFITKDDIQISFEKLSTGEKQIFTFLIYCGRKLKNKSSNFVIIDEPELSLHVNWQSKLLKQLLSKGNLSILTATHSPYVLKNEFKSSIKKLGDISYDQFY